jgi:hexokinase
MKDYQILFSPAELLELSNTFEQWLGTQDMSEIQLPPTNFINPGDIFQVMIMGGTHFQNGIFHQCDSVAELISRTQDNMSRFVTAEDCGDFFIQHLDLTATKVVLNFTFPTCSCIRSGRLDGILISGSKGYTFDGLVGSVVGEFLENYVFQKTGRLIQVMVVNDIVPLMVSNTFKNKTTVVGGIVGTGLNFGFWKNQNTLVVVEPEKFIDYPHLFDHIPDVAGGYLYSLYNTIALEKDWLQIHSTMDLNAFTESDNLSQATIAKALLERSASVVAGMVAGIFRYKNLNQLQLIMEGSLYWHGHNYQQYVWKYLAMLGLDQHKVSISHNPDSLLATASIGAWKA